MKERSVLITGSLGGIGSVLVTKFYESGWYVIGSDKSETCNAQCHDYISLNLLRMCVDEEYAQDRMNVLLEKVPHGTLKALINNAAVQIVAPFQELGMAEWRETIDVNILAPVFIIKSLLPELEAARGSIVNIESVHSRLTKPGFSAYATSKAALAGLTRALAVELGGRVRVNAISPAAIQTPMLEAGFSSNTTTLKTLEDYHPSGCIGTADEVAGAALYLVEGLSPFVTGTTIELTGGIAARLHDPG